MITISLMMAGLMWTLFYSLFTLLLRAFTTCADNASGGCWVHNVVPFKISHGFNDTQIYQIREVIGEFHRFTCIRWADGERFPNDAKNHVVFQKAAFKYICRSSNSLLSNGGNVTVVQLGDNCFKRQVLLHELMHVLGFLHEHQRADRDCYVFIDFKDGNVIAVSLAKEVPISEDEVGIRHERWLERFPYDKSSITHYPRSTLMKVKLKKKYIKQPQEFSNEPLGNEQGELSFFDVWKILYKFCGFPHYCDVFPPLCKLMDLVESPCAKKQKLT